MTELVVDKQMCRYCWDVLETRLGIQKSEPEPKFDSSIEWYLRIKIIYF